MRAGNYELLSPVREEALGTLHLARHLHLERDAHVLVVTPALAKSDAFRLRFLREMRSVGRLDHPHVLRLVDMGLEGSTLYVVLEQEQGKDSAEWVAEMGRLAPAAAFQLGLGTAKALIHAHLKGILHRQLHPRQVWVRPDGSALVRGFGLAPPPEVGSVAVPAGQGDLPPWWFQAPEVLSGQSPDAASDLWSLGALLCFWLTGSPPCPVRTLEERLERTHAVDLRPVLASDPAVPGSAAELVNRMLAREPAARPESLHQVKAELEEILESAIASRALSVTPPGLSVGSSFQTAGGLQSYQILEKRGHGGFGAVYKVKDRRNDRVLALKVMNPENLGRAKIHSRFQREGAAVRALDHPNIVKIAELGEEDGAPYILMEYVDGPDLREAIQANGMLPPERAVSIASGVARGLAAAHAAGVIHRDLSPSNVLLDPLGRVVLTDFGLALVPGQTQLTMTGDLLGTPQYLAPEIVRGQPADERTDLYGLGLLLYEMLAGKPPFLEESVWTLFRRILEHEPPYREDLPPRTPTRLRALVSRLLEKDAASRHASAGEVLAELEAIEEELE